jgi:hypothetical protein
MANYNVYDVVLVMNVVTKTRKLWKFQVIGVCGTINRMLKNKTRKVTNLKFVHI